MKTHNQEHENIYSRLSPRWSHLLSGCAVILSLILGFVLLTGDPVSAQPITPPEDLTVNSSMQGVTVIWRNLPAARRQAEPTWMTWPKVDIQGMTMPARLIAVRMSKDTASTPQVRTLRSQPLAAVLASATQTAQPIPQLLEGDLRPDLAPPVATRLPNKPVVLLRQGRLRGVRVAVYAVLPFFEDAAGLQEVTELRFLLPDASLLETAENSFPLDGGNLVLKDLADPYTRASQQAIKIVVSRAGLQTISGAELAAAGLEIDALDPTMLHLELQGQAVGLDIVGDKDGRLDGEDELRFYAPEPGDRWNQTDTYWLTVQNTAGLRMAASPPATATTSARTDGLAVGRWQPGVLYDSNLPGPDGDHWFAANLRTGPQQQPMTVTVPIPSPLPILTDTATFTVTGSAFTAKQHRLVVESVDAQAAFSRTLEWTGTGDWTQSFSGPGDVTALHLILTPGEALDGVEIDSVSWARPVTLDFGHQGAFFSIAPGTSTHRLTNLPEEFVLLDVTTAKAPTIIAQSPHSGDLFIDAAPIRRDYLLASLSMHRLFLPLVSAPASGAGAETKDGKRAAGMAAALIKPETVHKPGLMPHAPVDLTAPLDAQAVYIAPEQFQAALAPLVTLRQTQGYSVQVVDVQAIYDTWSYGQVSPDAIREFLRYAAANWQIPPIAATLVGDGTSDPYDFLGRHNTNFIPPYLAMVDPWIGETACETCYGQLDGADPLDDPLQDLMIGRLTVKSESELQVVVAKIVGYETMKEQGLDWRSRAVYVADNFRAADGKVDGAGDFAAAADASIALMPDNLEIRRVYYDPWTTHNLAPWREPDAVKAYNKTMQAMNDGAGLVNYIGHAHFWQWASTDLNATPPYLFGLLDVDTLTNQDRLPIVVEMTCLTSMFQQPAFSGTTIDERLLVHEGGGAVAVWGPTGLGVAYGHDTLQSGFYKAMWADDPVAKPLGALTEAGFLELFTDGLCCQENLRTFAILGDPLTVPEVRNPKRIYLPDVQR